MTKYDHARANIMAAVDALYAGRPYSDLPRNSISNFVRNLVQLLS